MLLAILGIAGLVATAVGTGLAAWGQAQQNEAQIKADELKAQQLREQQTLALRQEQIAQEEITAAGTRYQVQQTALGIRGSQLAYQAGAATGSIQAQAGVGNIGGASVLRRAMTVQRQYQEQTTLLEGERTETRLGYESAVRQGEFAAEAARIQGKQIGENAVMAQENADWLRKYGWMSVAATVASGVGQMAGQAAGIPWGSLSRNPFQITPSPGSYNPSGAYR